MQARAQGRACRPAPQDGPEPTHDMIMIVEGWPTQNPSFQGPDPPVEEGWLPQGPGTNECQPLSTSQHRDRGANFVTFDACTETAKNDELDA